MASAGAAKNALISWVMSDSGGHSFQTHSLTSVSISVKCGATGSKSAQSLEITMLTTASRTILWVSELRKILGFGTVFTNKDSRPDQSAHLGL